MEKLVKIIIATLLSLGGIGAVSASQSHSQETNDNINVTVTPNETQSQSQITLEEAKAIALNKINGTVQSYSEDDDEYTFIIEKDNNIYKVEVNKINGTIDDVDLKSTNAAATLSLEEAKAIALAQVNGTIQKTELNDDEYKIAIEKDGYTYIIEIDRYTGEIDDIDKKVIKTTASQDQTKTETKTENKKTTPTSLSLEEAKAIALKKVNGTVRSTETDDDEYKIVIEKDNYIYEIEVNRFTGKIEDVDKEVISTTQKKISSDEAKKIALNQVNGNVVDVDYDNEDNEYEIKVKTSDGTKYEIEINGETGQIISVEKD